MSTSTIRDRIKELLSSVEKGDVVKVEYKGSTFIIPDLDSPILESLEREVTDTEEVSVTAIKSAEGG